MGRLVRAFVSRFLWVSGVCYFVLVWWSLLVGSMARALVGHILLASLPGEFFVFGFLHLSLYIGLLIYHQDYTIIN